MKPLSWIIGASVLILVVASVMIWSRNVQVIVPKDFRGLVRVRPNPSAASPTIGWFKLVVEVPPSGELFLPTLDVLRHLHRQRASFSDGSPLPFMFPGDSFEGVAFQVMNTPPTEQVFYFVGTRDELIDYLKGIANSFSPLHLNLTKRHIGNRSDGVLCERFSGPLLMMKLCK